MKNQTIRNLVFLVVIILSHPILAQTSVLTEEDYKGKLEEFKQSGNLEVFSDNFDSLTDQQKSGIIDNINNQKFWENWKNMPVEIKGAFSETLNQNQLDNFMHKFSDYYKVSFKGFDKNTRFGVKGVIGNEKVYFNAEKIANYNKGTRINDPITSIEYQKQNNNDILKIIKKSGATAEVIVGEDKSGYYFEPKTHYFGKIKKQNGKYLLDFDDPLTGKWNGKGHLTLDLSNEDLKVSLDYKRDDGQADISNFATFKTNSREFSVMRKPTGEKDKNGKTIYELNKAEITFDKDGKLKKLHDVYVKDPKFNGFFGANTNVFNSKNDYDSLSPEAKENLGAYLIIDEENGFVGGDVARQESEGIAKVSGITEILKDWANERKNYINDLLDATVRLESQDIIDSIAQGFGLEKNNPLVTLLSGDDERIVGRVILKASLEKYLEYASAKATVAESIASAVYDETSSQIYKKPLEGTLLNLQLKNSFAKTLKNVDLRGGSLSIEDNSGKMINVVREATPYNYILNGDFNKKNPHFSGINFILNNENLPEQQIQIYSDRNGELNAKGIGTTILKKVGGRTYSVQGNVNVRGRSFGIININNPFYDRIFSMEYKASPETIKKAQDYLYNSEDRKNYLKLYNFYKQEGLTQAEIKELRKKAGDITIKYNNILGEGDSSFSINYLSSQQPQKFSQAMYDFSERFIKASKSKSGSSLLPLEEDIFQKALSVSADRVIYDPRFRDSLVQGGLTNREALINAGKKQIGEIGYFLRNNYNSGNSLVFVEDSKNNLYQLKIGSKTMNLDPALGSFTSEVLPLIVGQGGINSRGNFYINPNVWRGNRLIDSKEVTSTVYRGYSVIGAMRAGGKSGIQQSVQNELQNKVGNSIRIPN